MNRRLKDSPSAPIQLRAQLLSFAYTNSSSPFQSAYWTNKNTLCYHWCVDTLGSSLWNMLLKFWSSDLRLICLVYPCMITVSHFDNYLFPVVFHLRTCHVMYLLKYSFSLWLYPALICMNLDPWRIKNICALVLWLSYG
jgi:hypothetical protein